MSPYGATGRLGGYFRVWAARKWNIPLIDCRLVLSRHLEKFKVLPRVQPDLEEIPQACVPPTYSGSWTRNSSALPKVITRRSCSGGPRVSASPRSWPRSPPLTGLRSSTYDSRRWSPATYAVSPSGWRIGSSGRYPPSCWMRNVTGSGASCFWTRSPRPRPRSRPQLTKLILDRRLGEYRIPDHWAIFAAGNRQGDRA